MKTTQQNHRRGAIVIVLMFTGLCLACAPQATEHEIQKMCTHLAELRNKPGDEKMIRSCIIEANNEGTTQKQALCKISAVNKLEYWNRCRTGEARQ